MGTLGYDKTIRSDKESFKYDKTIAMVTWFTTEMLYCTLKRPDVLLVLRYVMLCCADEARSSSRCVEIVKSVNITLWWYNIWCC